MSDWISVKDEKLPLKKPIYVTDGKKVWLLDIIHGAYLPNNITHWMHRPPVPEPPMQEIEFLELPEKDYTTGKWVRKEAFDSLLDWFNDIRDLGLNRDRAEEHPRWNGIVNLSRIER